jgi:hypothetical protein
MFKNQTLSLGLGLMLALWGSSGPVEAQIETANGAVVSPRSPEMKIRTFFQGADNGDSYGIKLIGTWGLTRKDELRASLPLYNREYLGNSVFGIGDLYLRYKRSIHQDDGVMSSDRFAIFVDTTLPTGASRAACRPIRAQLGLGTPQLGAGLIYSVVRDRHRFSVELGHRQPLGEGLAGTSRLNLAYWYRLTPAQFPEHEQVTEVRGVMELLSELRGPEQGRDAGTLILLAPGFQIHPSSSTQFEINALIPLAQSLHDDLGQRRLGGSATVKLRF